VCASTVDIQSATADIVGEEKKKIEDRNPPWQIYNVRMLRRAAIISSDICANGNGFQHSPKLDRAADKSAIMQASRLTPMIEAAMTSWDELVT